MSRKNAHRKANKLVRERGCGGKSVRIGSSRESLMAWISSRELGRSFPSEQRAEAFRNQKPLPARPCVCCNRDQSWPVGYRWAFDDDLSYECGLHQQSESFLQSLPSSRSFVGWKLAALVYG
jgi:hypothetical protein